MSTHTTAISAPAGVPRLQFPVPAWAFIAAALAAAIVPFSLALSQLYDIWNLRPEYSHGILIPLISLILIWRQRDWLAATPFKGSWSGLLFIVSGLLLGFAGELATIWSLAQYGFFFVLAGMVLCLTGWAVLRRLWMPLVILIFMVPLPAFMGATLSLKMQLISSWLGVLFIRLAGISVFLEGNVIDLGVYKLQVAEACDGLRYLFPLMTLAFILSYFYRAPFWKKAVLFLSSVPIAILMNSIRIGAIGVTVEYWGPEMAEGLLHDFEGWVVFMLSTGVLILVAMLLSRIGPSRMHWRDALTLDMGPTRKQPTAISSRSISPSFFGASAVIALAAVLSLVLPERTEHVMPRSEFTTFPTHLGAWSGKREPMETVYLNALHLDDYVLANFAREGAKPVNLYVSYYDSQRQGQSAHSPRSCIPGGGWTIKSFEQRELPGIGPNGTALQVNRAVVELGVQRQIVYYWFQQRGRMLTNEYAVKWFIFWDALVRNRTDGAMIRVTTASGPGTSEAELDRELTQFAAAAVPQLTRHIPN